MNKIRLITFLYSLVLNRDDRQSNLHCIEELSWLFNKNKRRGVEPLRNFAQKTFFKFHKKKKKSFLNFLNQKQHVNEPFENCLKISK